MSTAEPHQQPAPASQIRKLLVVARHNGRGSAVRCEVLTRSLAALVDFLPDLPGMDEKVIQAIQGWDEDDDRALASTLNTDWTFGIGVARVTPEDKWLIIPDPNSDAAAEGELGIVNRGDDLDAVVKAHCMRDAKPGTPEDYDAEGRDEDGHQWNWKVPSGPLDWSGKTTYSCILPRYCSGDWNATDGCSGYEPNLFDGVGTGGIGIRRFDLDADRVASVDLL